MLEWSLPQRQQCRLDAAVVATPPVGLLQGRGPGPKPKQGGGQAKGGRSSDGLPQGGTMEEARAGHPLHRCLKVISRLVQHPLAPSFSKPVLLPPASPP